MNEVESIRASKDQLVSELRKLGSKVRGNSYSCPFHDDKHPSGSVYQKDGVWRFKCHGCGYCGDIFDVRSRAELKDRGELIREVRGNQHDEAPKPKRVFATVADIERSVSSLGPIEDVYTYTHHETKVTEVVQVRYRDGESKKFLTHHWAGSGYVMGAPPKPWPLYNRTRVAASSSIVVVEGEKCVKALHAVGIVATTSLSGAKNADKADWSLLAGKTVYVWPDNDEAGIGYANEVIHQLEQLAPRPTIYLFKIDGLGLPEHGDVADYIASDPEQGRDLWTVIREGSERVGVGSELAKRLEDIAQGRWSAVKWPWPILTKITKSLYPGTITMLCGEASASKSMLLLESFLWWHESGIRVALFETEDDRAFHLMRLLAICSGCWDVLEPDWVRANKDKVDFLYAQHASRIDSFAEYLSAEPVGTLRYAEALEWIKRHCNAKARVIGIDPITAVGTGENRHVEDHAFITSAARMVRDAGASLILVTHPRGGGRPGGADQDSLAGSRAFSRHTHTVLWLARHGPPKPFMLLDEHGLSKGSINCNRTVQVVKARNGPGLGKRVAFIQSHDVRFAEQGLIQQE